VPVAHQLSTQTVQVAVRMKPVEVELAVVRASAVGLEKQPVEAAPSVELLSVAPVELHMADAASEAAAAAAVGMFAAGKLVEGMLVAGVLVVGMFEVDMTAVGVLVGMIAADSIRMVVDVAVGVVADAVGVVADAVGVVAAVGVAAGTMAVGMMAVGTTAAVVLVVVDCLC
jgi:hypothetical protein